MNYKLAIIPGDTVGPELTRQAEKVLTAMTKRFRLPLQLTTCSAGAASVRSHGTPLPPETLEITRNSDAILLGNIGERNFSAEALNLRPEYALLELRKEYHVCTNLRPFFIQHGVEELSPLKSSFIRNGFDILLVRDIQGGMLNGPRSTLYTESGAMASDLELYHESTVKASARFAFEIARQRKKHVTSLDKANVLESSILWRKTVAALSGEYPDVTLSHQYIDCAAMDVIKTPGDFDVILTSNVFGDILSDELAQLSGTPNLFGSAELAQNGRGIYTPNQLHHPTEEYTGKNVISPLGMLNAVSMMLNHTLHRPDLSARLQDAIHHMFVQKITTAEFPISNFTKISTDEMGDEVVRYLLK